MKRFMRTFIKHAPRGVKENMRREMPTLRAARSPPGEAKSRRLTPRILEFLRAKAKNVTNVFNLTICSF